MLDKTCKIRYSVFDIGIMEYGYYGYGISAVINNSYTYITIIYIYDIRTNDICPPFGDVEEGRLFKRTLGGYKAQGGLKKHWIPPKMKLMGVLQIKLYIAHLPTLIPHQVSWKCIFNCATYFLVHCEMCINSLDHMQHFRNEFMHITGCEQQLQKMNF